MSSKKSLLKTSVSIISVLMISACSSVMETPNQKIEFTTPGAINAYCDVVVGGTTYQVYPPQEITVLKSRKPMTLNCRAPGNRDKSIVIESRVANTTFANVLNGGAGAFYDYGTGAMFKYPDKVFIDFSSERASSYSLPAYHEPDSIPNGYEPGIESTGPSKYETKTSYERSQRLSRTNEIEIRKMEVEHGPKGETSSRAPVESSPYFPEATFPGTTSF